jgi:hypothetical protein
MFVPFSKSALSGSLTSSKVETAGLFVATLCTLCVYWILISQDRQLKKLGRSKKTRSFMAMLQIRIILTRGKHQLVAVHTDEKYLALSLISASFSRW